MDEIGTIEATRRSPGEDARLYGRRDGDHELLGEIARGGMRTVYKARQVSLNRLVALKLISAGVLASEDSVKRFKAEAEAAAGLDHPNIVPIHEIGERDGQQYFSMSWSKAKSLAYRVSRSRRREAAADLTGGEVPLAHADGYRPQDAARLVATVARGGAFRASAQRVAPGP